MTFAYFPKWMRHGECNHCGWCCENIGAATIFFPDGNPVVGISDEAYIQIRGFRKTTSQGQLGVELEVENRAPCPAHVNDRCSVYENRPPTCQAYPWHPRQIINSPCSYWFEIDGFTMGGNASPHPWTGTRDEFAEHLEREGID